MLRTANIVLLLALVGCFAGALAGLIILAPFVAGAWLLNLVALLSYEERARPGWIEHLHASVQSATDEPQTATAPAEPATPARRAA